MSKVPNRVAIVGGTRIPFCRSNSFYSDLTNQDMMTAALNGLVERFNLKGKHIDEVIGGAVVHHSRDYNLTRECILSTKLSPTTPGITLQQACGTSLQAALSIAAKISSGEIESGIALGSDTTSDAPLVFSKKFSKRLLEMNVKKTIFEKLSVFNGFSPAELLPQPPSVKEPRTGLGMGEHCELMAQEWNIKREDQDRFAFESHKKASAAYEDGWMDDLITPTAGVFRDNNVRHDVNLEKLGSLKTVFDKSERGTITAANSSPLTDGASAVLLMAEKTAQSLGLPIQAFLTFGQHWGNNFPAGDGLLMAPTIAVSKMLDRARLTLQDFDFYEIHEAFAAQVLATLKAWEDCEYCQKYLGKNKPLGSLENHKLNVKGSSLAIGHPFAATGGRILATLSKLLDKNGGGRGLISICTAGGMGVCAILESRELPR